MIKMAKGSTDYVKFQLYDTMKLNQDYPDYESNFEFYAQCEITKPMLEKIFIFCKLNKVKPMFTLFNETRIDYLKPYLAEDFAIKIASPDASKIEYISKIRAELPLKLIVISCGMLSPEQEINVRTTIFYGVFLYCISKYPTRYRDVDFAKLKNYDGFSDHTMGLQVPQHLGMYHPEIKWYEKHYTLSRNLPTRDRIVSVEPKEIPSLYWYLKNKNVNKNYIERFSQK